MGPVWKAIKGFEGKYKISSCGRVFSFISNREIFGSSAAKKYRTVALAPGKKDRRYVHRLVAEAFIKNPKNYPCVNHLDGNTKNNDVKNLRWCSKTENNRHAFDSGLMDCRIGENNERAKLKNKDVIKIRNLLSRGVTAYKIAKTYNMSHSSIYLIKSGKNWGRVK